MARRRRNSKLFPLFPTPDEIVRSYLVTGERVIHVDKPALDAFVVIQLREVLIAAGLFVLFVWSVVTGRGGVLPLVAFIAFDAVLVWLIVKRMQAFYTRYVITTLRVMRVSGIITRRNVWIPWVKMTDLSFRQSFLGRLFGYATIRIESANEESGLQDLSDLKDPIRFNRILVEMVSAKQGSVTLGNADAVFD
jgi:uncharacterized membrane protein YdbT with pleckstrin-like domain